MTNRQHLQKLSNDDFAEAVLRKAAEFEGKYMNSELDPFDMMDMIEMDFAVWLSEKYEI